MCLPLSEAYRCLPRPSSPWVCQAILHIPLVAWLILLLKYYGKNERFPAFIALSYIIVKDHMLLNRSKKIYFDNLIIFFYSCRSNLVELRRIELLTPCLQGRCSPSWATAPNEDRKIKWARVNSNHWPRPYQGRALTNWATGPKLEESVFSIQRSVNLSDHWTLNTDHYQIKKAKQTKNLFTVVPKTK